MTILDQRSPCFQLFRRLKDFGGCWRRIFEQGDNDRRDRRIWPWMTACRTKWRVWELLRTLYNIARNRGSRAGWRSSWSHNLGIVAHPSLFDDEGFIHLGYWMTLLSISLRTVQTFRRIPSNNFISVLVAVRGRQCIQVLRSSVITCLDTELRFFNPFITLGRGSFRLGERLQEQFLRSSIRVPFWRSVERRIYMQRVRPGLERIVLQFFVIRITAPTEIAVLKRYSDFRYQ